MNIYGVSKENEYIIVGEGGAGSGNFAPGHKGIPGHRGGSKTKSSGGGGGGIGSSETKTASGGGGFDSLDDIPIGRRGDDKVLPTKGEVEDVLGKKVGDFKDQSYTDRYTNKTFYIKDNDGRKRLNKDKHPPGPERDKVVDDVREKTYAKAKEYAKKLHDHQLKKVGKNDKVGKTSFTKTGKTHSYSTEVTTKSGKKYSVGASVTPDTFYEGYTAATGVSRR